MVNPSFLDSEQNPYQSPGAPIVKAELVKPEKKRETLIEVISRVMVWGGITFIAMLVMAAMNLGIGKGEVFVVAIGFAAYWVPRLLIARRS